MWSTVTILWGATSTMCTSFNVSTCCRASQWVASAPCCSMSAPSWQPCCAMCNSTFVYHLLTSAARKHFWAQQLTRRACRALHSATQLTLIFGSWTLSAGWRG